jgi:phosphate acetyltransferase
MADQPAPPTPTGPTGIDRDTPPHAVAELPRPTSSSVYITATRVRAGKTVVALGVAEMLARDVGRIAVFRPVVPDPTPARPVDPLAELVIDRFHLDQAPDDASSLTYSEVARLASTGGLEPVIARLVDDYAKLAAGYDFVIILGSDFTGPAPGTELEFNAELAANLGAPVLPVVGAADMPSTRVPAAVAETARVLASQGCAVVATVVSRVAPSLLEQVRALVADATPPVYAIPDVPVLSALTVAEIADAVGGQVLAGAGEALQREVTGYITGSGYLPAVLRRLADGSLLVASADRMDLAVGMAAAAASPDLPTPAGVVLTGGGAPDEHSARIFGPSGVPVVSVNLDTYTTMHAIEGAHGEIRATSRRKIAAALGAFADAVDTDALGQRIRRARSDVVTPTMFAFRLAERARVRRQRIVLPEGDDDRVLLAAEQLLRSKVADLTIFGDPATVQARAGRLGVSLSGAQLMDPAQSDLRGELAEHYRAARAHKGVTAEQALDIVGDASYFATLLVATGRVDGMVSGATHTTAHTIRPAMELLRDPDAALVSSVFFMCLPDRVLVFGDCAVNPNPNPGQLADIAARSARTAATFGIEPKVALVSYSTGASGAGADVDKVREAAELLAARHPELPMAGPIQYDAAVDPTTGAAKLPGNPVAGHATVLIFPDLNTGNATYKAVQRSARAVAVGPVLQGLRRPVNDLSRGCTVPDIVNTVAITAIQAQRLP